MYDHPYVLIFHFLWPVCVTAPQMAKPSSPHPNILSRLCLSLCQQRPYRLCVLSRRLLHSIPLFLHPCLSLQTCLPHPLDQIPHSIRLLRPLQRIHFIPIPNESLHICLPGPHAKRTPPTLIREAAVRIIVKFGAFVVEPLSSTGEEGEGARTRQVPR